MPANTRYGGKLSDSDISDIRVRLGNPSASGASFAAPCTLHQSTENSAASHIHAILSASNPGAAASLLASSGSGTLILQAMNVGSATNASPGELWGRRDWNGDTTWNITNASPGTAAQVRLMLENVDYDVQLGLYSACTTALGAISACRGFLYTDAIDGLVLMADTCAITFAAGDTASNARLTGTGQWQLPTVGDLSGVRLGGDVQLWRSAANVLGIGNGGLHNQISNVAGTATVFNETGADIDFRVEGNTASSLIFVDAGEDRVGVGTATPQTTFHVNGVARIETALLVATANVTGEQKIAVGGTGSTESSDVPLNTQIRLIPTTLSSPSAYAELQTGWNNAVNQSRLGFNVRYFSASFLDRIVMELGAGVQVGTPTGGDQGAGTINLACTIYIHGVAPASAPGAASALLKTSPNGVLRLSGAEGTSAIFAASIGATAIAAYANITDGNGIYGVGNASNAVGVFGDCGSAGLAAGYFASTGSGTAGYFVNSAGSGFALWVDAGSTQIDGAVKILGGVQLGTPTGGNKGAGTMNVATDIYKNNSAYGNPAYALELWATGKIEKHADKDGAKGYRRPTIDEAERHIRETFELPGHQGDFGIFNGGDWLLEKVEELYTYIIELQHRIRQLEGRERPP